MSGPNRLYLIDAYALIFRAYYAFIRAPRINSKGMNTSAVFGFTNALVDVLKNHNPTHIAVAFDPPGGCFRVDDYALYKANRDETPEDIKRAVPYIKEIIEGFRIPVFESPGFEADDVIGTLAHQAAAEGFEVFMVTPDKDFAQLVTDRIRIHRPAKNGGSVEIWGVDEVKEKFQVKDPLQVIDILGMWGDAADNIPGIPGVGEKTAKKLIAEYESIEGLLEHSDELKGKLKEKVKDNAAQALLSKKLATIRLDVPVEFDPEKLIVEEPDKEKLKAVFADLEFRTLSERVLGERVMAGGGAGAQMDLFGDSVSQSSPVATPAQPEISADYTLVDTVDKRQKLVKELLKQQAFCFDTETTGLDANEAELVGIAFSFKGGSGYYVPLPD